MSLLKCPRCSVALSPAPEVRGLQAVSCGACGTGVELETFPALWRAPQPGRPGEWVTGDEAPCFVHADRRAEAACDQCGRYVCALCDVRVGSRHLCVSCLEAGRKGRNMAELARHRTILPSIAVRIVLFSVFLGPFAVFTVLPAIVMAVWGLIKPASITGSRHVLSALAAIILGLAQFLLWSAFWIGTTGVFG